jgi:signal transduction histidine kinase
MGLSIVSSLVEKYNGVISARDRKPGDCSHGTCFEVAFPKVDSRNHSRQCHAPEMFAYGEATDRYQ